MKNQCNARGHNRFAALRFIKVVPALGEAAPVIDVDMISAMHRCDRSEHFRPGPIHAIDIEPAAAVENGVRPERVLAVGRDEVQVDFRFRHVPGAHDA